ncbi:MAG: FAD-dependent oxidoreductase [bacterium]|nr:MAG: FAD-dependent oxidoreductase [bacterium]
MSKPIILSTDDEIEVGNAIERDLKKKFGKNFRIIKTTSGKEALDTIRQLKQRNDQIALFLTDQRMPEMEGTEFLEEAMKLYPEARKVLLTAYADTDAAIAAINKLALDYYLMKPWDPPEEKLYPIISDLLEDWQSINRPPFEGIRVIGNQWAPASYQVKTFLVRNNIPYLWLDVEQTEEARELIKIPGKPDMELPCLIFPDGTVLQKPENRDIAERVGLRTSADKPFYDLIIVGAGPAGLAAAVYGASEGLHTLVIEQQAPGGQAGMSSRIENYLGFPGGLSGRELARRAVTQARRFGVEILTAQKVVKLIADGPSRIVKLADGKELGCRALLIATGVSYRQVQAKGIEKLTGAGVYYGSAMSEGESVRGRNVFIVGGANSAGQAAMYLSQFAKKVIILIRGESLSSSMSRYLIDQIGATANIQVWKNREVKETIGSDRLEKLVLWCKDRQKDETVEASALFIFIGAQPHTEWLGDIVARDEHGFILSGPDIPMKSRTYAGPSKDHLPFLLETSLPGVFVAGDVRHGSVKRVASAVGEGSMAVMYIHRYLGSV